jgi:hypothetical protein
MKHMKAADKHMKAVGSLHARLTEQNDGCGDGAQGAPGGGCTDYYLAQIGVYAILFEGEGARGPQGGGVYAI